MDSKFRYEYVRNAIHREIENGKYQEHEQIPHGTELAQRFEVSIATINRALKDLVSEGFLTRIPKKGTIVRSRTEWNQSRGGRSYLIGAIVYDASRHPLWSIALRGIEDAVQAHECNLLVGNDDGDFSKAQQYVRQFAQRGIDGIAYVPIGAASREAYEERNLEIVGMLEQEGIPFVQFHRTVGTPRIAVTLDDYRDTRTIVRKMFESGSRRPICVSHYYSSCSADREEAFVDELRANGVVDAESRVLRLHPSGQKTSLEQLPELRDRMRRTMPFDGVFAMETDTLEVAVEAEKTIGHGPTQVIWACVDYSADTRATGMVDFAIAPPTYDLGYMTGESLIAQIDMPHSIPHRIVLPSKLVISGRARSGTHGSTPDTAN
jgi:DNA-binding LacI/PurR family transcriptional regulator